MRLTSKGEPVQRTPHKQSNMNQAPRIVTGIQRKPSSPTNLNSDPSFVVQSISQYSHQPQIRPYLNPHIPYLVSAAILESKDWGFEKETLGERWREREEEGKREFPNAKRSVSAQIRIGDGYGRPTHHLINHWRIPRACGGVRDKERGMARMGSR